MPILIGTDEAGYGPNLGPLVVAATAWQVPADMAPSDLFPRLAHVIRSVPEPADSATDRATRPDDRLAMADSKLLYQPGGGLATLERGVLGALGVRQRPAWPASWRNVFHSLAPDSAPTLLAAPWFRAFDCPAPIDVPAAEQREGSRRLQLGLEQAGVRLLELRATTIGPEEFNREVRRRGSKGSLLTDTTLALVNRLLDDVTSSPDDVANSPDDRASGGSQSSFESRTVDSRTDQSRSVEPCIVTCDKHGGRNRYMGPLQHAFPDGRIDVLAEGREASRYRLERRGRRVTIEFRVGGEQLLPAALASMTAKYLRELAMRAFNAFWLAHVPGLQPTAGYPVDARRFWNDIRLAQARLNVTDDELWRER